MESEGHCFDSCLKLENVQIDNVIVIPQYCFSGCSLLNTIISENADTIKSYCFSQCSRLTTITLPALINIENNAFTQIETIKEIDFPNVKKIGNEAFKLCTGLLIVNLKACTEIGSFAFYDCTALSTISVPELKSISVGAFRNTGIITIDLPKLDTLYLGKINNVDNAGGYFFDCKYLTSVNAPSALSIPALMFSGCARLSKLSMDLAEYIGSNAFSGCTDLASLILPKVKNIGRSLFSYCTNFINIQMNSVTYIGRDAFYACTNLETISFEQCTSIDNAAFSGCTKLNTIHLPNLAYLSIRVFEGTALTTVELNKVTDCSENQYLDKTKYGAHFQYCQQLTTITLNSITKIGPNMFFGCSSLTTVNVPEATLISYDAFSGCTSFKDLVFPKLSSIYDSAFASLTSIVSVNLPSVTYIGRNAFNSCTNLETISFEQCTLIGNAAFSGCTKLNTIHLPNLTYLNIRVFESTALTTVELNKVTDCNENQYLDKTRYGAHFQYCQQLTTITLNSITKIGPNMFFGCSSLTTVNVPEVTSISYNAFSGCTSFTDLVFPKLSSIYDSAFASLTSIVSVNLPSVTYIDRNAFNSCTNLETISFEQCTSIGHTAFSYCTKLNTIHLPNLTYLNIRVFESTALTTVELNKVTDCNEGQYLDKTNYGAQFQYCQQLTTITLNSIAKIGRNMFLGCNKLSEINFPVATSISSSSLTNCISIKKVTLGYTSVSFTNIPNPALITHAYFPSAVSVPENSFLNFQELLSCKLPIVSTIGASAFEGCTRLTELEIPKAIEFIGDKTFYNCESLESILIQSLVKVDPNSANIFQGCRNLKSITMPSLPPKVFHSDTFKNLKCQLYIPPDSLQVYDDDISIAGDSAGDGYWCNVELIEFQYTKVLCNDEIEGMATTLYDACVSTGLAFSEIENLVIISGAITQNDLTSMKSYFVNLKELTIQSQVSIENQIVPNEFFKNHQEIQSVKILNSIRTIDESAFEGCSKLSLFICTNARELKSRCFYGPTSIESLTFELVDTLSGSNFFSNNPKLTTIELPKLATLTVNGYISENSPLLQSISLPETPPIFNDGTFLVDVTPKLIGISNDAAIAYDAADGVNNDMRYYSLKLSYVLVICNIDGEAKSGISLKSLVSEDSQVVEVVEGTIGTNDFPLPSSITSFTIQENVIVEAIPKNAFSSSSSLKMLKIVPSKNSFPIEESAFDGCTNLDSVQINGATSIAGLAFNGCVHLKTVVLDNVLTITGNSHFYGCSELSSLSLKSLTTVPVDSSMIFLGCTKLTTLYLPSNPPKTFNNDVFSGLHDKLNLFLPKEDDYITYDKDDLVAGDIKNDGLWCGLILPTSIINMKVNDRGSFITGLKLSDCIAASGLQESSIISLEITRGILDTSTLLETINKLPNLENLIISKSLKFRGEWTEGMFSGLNLVTINLPSVTTIPKRFFENCASLKEIILDNAITVNEAAFKGCTSLEAINLRVQTFNGDSIFEGCTSLDSITLSNLVNVDSTAANIFKDCPLTSITLPTNPPKTFNKNTFIGMNVIINGLTDDQLRDYDANIEVDGDSNNDLKWCGINLIQLYITISINGGDEINAASLTEAIGTTPIQDVTSIEIRQGMVKKIHLDEVKSFTQLKTFRITEDAHLESSLLDSEQFKDMASLTTVQIMQNVTIMQNCFMDCTSLASIEFKSVDILYEGCFRGCSSLNEIFVPNCVELRGDFIFSGCAKLPEIDLSSLLKVDNTASKIFEGCTQLNKISLPSEEPRTFNKNAFTDCPSITINLPNNEDYLTYDDFSHVADDIKEDSKWCGIEINSDYLPPLLSFKINDEEYQSRKLTTYKDAKDSTLKLLDEEEIDKRVKSLHLTGGLCDSSNVKEFLVGCDTIETFEADTGTLNELQTGTFKDCSSIKEIIIHCQVTIGAGAISNLPSLTKIALNLQPTMYGGEFTGDTGLQEISLPILATVPSDLFSGLTNLNTVDLHDAKLMLRGCFKGCTSLSTLSLPNLNQLNGDSQFEGCTALKTLEMPLLETVPKESPLIFKDCSALETLTLGQTPPNIFNEDIFKNANTIPNVVVPSENSWKNYIIQCSVNPENKHYIWYGFETPLTEDDTVITCPECPTCPEQKECPTCPEQKECPICPEQKECPTPKKENKTAALAALGVVCGICVIAIIALSVYIFHLKKYDNSFIEDDMDNV